jgi:hypothetical protein
LRVSGGSFRILLRLCGFLLGSFNGTLVDQFDCCLTFGGRDTHAERLRPRIPVKS